MTEQELILAYRRGIIKPDDVARLLDMNILKEYQNKIWQATDGRYKVKMPDGKLLAKTKREDLEQAILAYIKADEKRKDRGPTFHDYYLKWLNSKRILINDKGEPIKNRHSVKEATLTKYVATYSSYYAGQRIEKLYIKEISKKDITDFLDGIIYQYNFDTKQYYNFSVIIRQMMDWAYEEEIIDNNPMTRYRLPDNIPSPEEPDAKNEVFTNEEINAIYKVITDRKNRKYIVPLMIALAFKLGLRNGELVALKWTDIEGDYMHIQRSEIRYYEIDANGKKGKYIHAIGEPKTKAGKRWIYLTDEAKEILHEARKIMTEQGLYDGDWMFRNEKGERIHVDATDKYIRRACAAAQVLTKSMHKIRKTTLTQLVDAGMNMDAVRLFAGQIDRQTIYKAYYRNRTPQDLNNKLQEEATSTKCNQIVTKA